MTASASQNLGFPLKLYGELTLSGCRNLFFSPYSIHSAMSMLLLGCRGNSESELMKLLEAHESIHEENSQIRESWAAAVEGIEISTANQLFVEKSYKLVEKFVSECSKYYESEVKGLDFQHSANDARKHINEWVEKQTKEKIKDLIAQGDVDASTKAVLVNAIYFKGKWQYEFDKNDTEKKDFHTSRFKSKKIDIMSQKGGFRFAKSKALGAKILELDYKGQNVSMVIVLPMDTLGLTKVEKKFTAEHLDELRGPVRVKLMVPKFKMEYQCGLEETFKKLGVKSIFGDDADLSGISGAKDLFVSAIIHKAFVEVNEEGTEAAAATAVVMVLKGGFGGPPKIKEFICDHPFLFLIRYKPTNTILFIGRYLGPDN